MTRRQYGVIGDQTPPTTSQTRGEIPTRPEWIKTPKTDQERAKNDFWRALSNWADDEHGEIETDTPNAQHIKRCYTAGKQRHADEIRRTSVTGYRVRPAVDVRDYLSNDAEHWRQFARGFYAWLLRKAPKRQEKYIKFLNDHALKFRDPEEFNK